MSKFAEFILETSSTTGTGDFALSGPPDSLYDPFSDVWAVGSENKFYYAIKCPITSQKEWGIGYLSDSSTLVRETIKGGSNGTSPVDFGAGTKLIYATPIADSLLDKLSDLSAYGLSFIALADAEAARDALELGESDSPTFDGIAINGTATIDADLLATGSALVITSTTPSGVIGQSRGISVNLDISDGMPLSAMGIAVYAATVGAGTVLNAYGLVLEKQTIGTSVNRSLYCEGEAEFNDVILAESISLHDTNDSHYLTIVVGSDLTASRALTITTGDADRTITLSGSPTLADWFNQSIKTTASPTFVGVSLTGNLTLPTASATVGRIIQNATRVFHTVTNNTFVGSNAGNFTLSGAYNVGLGHQACDALTTAFNALGIGRDALGSLQSGNNNVGVGAFSLQSITTGVEHMVGIGTGAMSGITGGVNSVGIGTGTAELATSLSYCVAIGAWANRISGTITNGVALGYMAGYQCGSGCIMIGYQAGFSETGSNKLYIDNSNTTTPLIHGDFSTRVLTVNGSFQIDANAVAGNTRMLVWDVSAGSLKRVSLGAADSGGAGYKLLRVPN